MVEQISLLRKSNPKVFEIVRFLFVGGVATIIDMAIMALVIYLPNKNVTSLIEIIKSQFIPQDWLVVLATAIGFILGLIFNYIFSILYVYEGENKYAKTKRGFVLFLLLSTIGLLIQTLGMYIGYSLLNLNEWLIKIFLVFVVLTFNYITRKIFIFNKDKIDNKSLKNSSKKNIITKQSLLFNILFIISSMSLTKLLYTGERAIDGYIYALASGLIVTFFMFYVIKNLIQKIELKSKSILISSIIFACCTVFCFRYFHSVEIFKYDWIIMLVLASFSIFVYSNILIKFTFTRIRRFWLNISQTEKIIFLSIFFISSLICIITFCFTNVFAVSKNTIVDSFVSFDTGYMSSHKSFINIRYAENDSRHVLLGLCTFPFAVIPFVLSKIFFFIPEFYSLLMTFVQCSIASYTIIKIEKFLQIKGKAYIVLFSILFFVSAGTIFNVITLEKFMFALFYLLLFMTLDSEKNPLKWIVLVGVVGVLTTNAFLIPIIILKEKLVLKKNIAILFDFIILFFCVTIVFGSFSTIIHFPQSLMSMLQFSSVTKNIEFIDKIYQFFIFISSMFIFPQYILQNNILIQVEPTFNINVIIGIIIFALIIISFVINKKNKFARLCFYWEIFMLVLLVIFGWGSARNEMFIYSSIFLWPTLSLLWMLINKISSNIIKISILSLLIIIIGVLNIYYLTDIINLMSPLYPSVL